MSALLVNWIPPLATAAVAVLLAVFLFRYFAEPIWPGLSGVEALRRLFSRRENGEEGGEKPVRGEWSGRLCLWILGMFLLSRLFVYGVALAGAWNEGSLPTFFAHPDWYWVRWDANHYIGLIENWYVNVGDPRFHIVFFPFYPLVCRLLLPFFGGHSVLDACAVSNVCLLAAAFLLYALTSGEQGRSAARRAVLYLLFNPLSLFFSIPYTEAMLLMLSLAAVLLARRRHMGWALLLGAMAAATRMVGLLTAIPVYLEFLKLARARGSGRVYRRLALRYALCTCAIASGFLAYLLLNFVVTGNPLQFMVYQSEHWGQEFGSLYNTLRYTLDYAFTYYDLGTRLGTWIPQGILICLVLFVIARDANRAHPGDAAYALIYLYLTVSPTWLLSGHRYLMAMYAIYPMLARLTRKKWQEAALLAGFLLAGCYFVYMYAIYGSLF